MGLKKIKELWDSRHPDLKTGKWGEIEIHQSIPILKPNGAHFELCEPDRKKDRKLYGVELHNEGFSKLDDIIPYFEGIEVDGYPIIMTKDKKNKTLRLKIAIPKSKGEDFVISVMEEFKEMVRQRLEKHNVIDENGENLIDLEQIINLLTKLPEQQRMYVINRISSSSR